VGPFTTYFPKFDIDKYFRVENPVIHHIVDADTSYDIVHYTRIRSLKSEHKPEGLIEDQVSIRKPFWY
jgi:hypothetical protein